MEIRHWKYIIPLYIVLIFTIITLVMENRSLDFNLNSAALKYQEATQQARTWEDLEGKARAEIGVLAGTVKEMKSAFEEKIRAYQQENTGLKKNLNNLQGIIEAGGYTQGNIETPIIWKRDIPCYHTNPPHGDFSYHDDWTFFEGSIAGENLALFYQVKDSVSFITTKQKKEYVVHGINHNPNSTIVGIREYRVVPEVPKWSVGVGVHYGIGPDGRGFFVGAGVQRSLIRF